MPKSTKCHQPTNQGWSKTKQVARRATPTLAQKRKCQLAEKRPPKAEERFVARELKKAAKLVGQPRRVTRGMQATDVPPDEAVAVA